MNKISQTKILRELMTWIVQNLLGVTCMIGVRTISGTLSSKSSILIYHYFPLILKITLLLIVFSLLRLFIVSQGPLSSKLSSVVCLITCLQIWVIEGAAVTSLFILIKYHCFYSIYNDSTNISSIHEYPN